MHKKNFFPLTPINFLKRSAEVFPNYLSIISENQIFTWKKTYDRCKMFCSALKKRGIKNGDVVSIMSPNITELYEAHFAIPMAGAIINTINIRLGLNEINFILNHSRSKLILIHENYLNIIKEINKKKTKKIPFILIPCKNSKIKYETYRKFLKKGNLKEIKFKIDDENKPLSLSYTSGTTGRLKGVLVSHRTAYLNSLGNKFLWKIDKHPNFLWTLPMFHSNGWRFPWTVAALAGTNICLRKIDVKKIIFLIKKYKVTNMCCAPIILKRLSEKEFKLNHTVEVLMAGSSPHANLIRKIQKKGFNVTHMYGLVEASSAAICEYQNNWSRQKEKIEILKSRQGVRNLLLDELRIVNAKTKKNVKWNSKEIGEIHLRGNIVANEYYKNKEETRKSFKNGWFLTGDLAVVHKDGYFEIKDRSKDIIISGGENISSTEIEKVINDHPKVLKSAVVGKLDENWGEVPYAFVNLKKNCQMEKGELIQYCNKKLAKFKLPKKFIFTNLGSGPTGKIKKYLIRRRLNKIRK